MSYTGLCDLKWRIVNIYKEAPSSCLNYLYFIPCLMKYLQYNFLFCCCFLRVVLCTCRILVWGLKIEKDKYSTTTPRHHHFAYLGGVANNVMKRNSWTLKCTCETNYEQWGQRQFNRINTRWCLLLYRHYSGLKYGSIILRVKDIILKVSILYNKTSPWSL